MVFWKRTVPLALAFFFGVLMVVQYFIPHKSFAELLDTMARWGQIVGAFALVVGLSSLIHSHVFKIKRQVPGWGYSVVTLAALVIYTVVGFISEGDDSPEAAFGWGYHHLLMPMQASMFSLLAFFIASAAYKAFRARTLEATVLLIIAVIVMLGRVPIGSYVYEKLPQVAEWIFSYPNMAARRAIMLGVALAMVATSLRVIVGIERSYLGGGD
ncbi:MAG: hypothetical protein N2234_04160 [Planctomycetota bacterium]|nr:hypothetical protein [Planctomycetota bacterium]